MLKPWGWLRDGLLVFAAVWNWGGQPPAQIIADGTVLAQALFDEAAGTTPANPPWDCWGPSDAESRQTATDGQGNLLIPANPKFSSEPYRCWISSTYGRWPVGLAIPQNTRYEHSWEIHVRLDTYESLFFGLTDWEHYNDPLYNHGVVIGGGARLQITDFLFSTRENTSVTVPAGQRFGVRITLLPPPAGGAIGTVRFECDAGAGWTTLSVSNAAFARYSTVNSGLRYGTLPMLVNRTQVAELDAEIDSFRLIRGAYLGPDPAATRHRPVLIEEFSATWCPPCYGAALGLDLLDDWGYETEVVVVAHHTGDEFATPFSDAVNNRYAVESIPTVRFNGLNPATGGWPLREGLAGVFAMHAFYESQVVQELERMAGAEPFELAFSGGLGNPLPEWQLMIKSRGDYANPVCAVFLLIEDHVPCIATNGLQEINALCRQGVRSEPMTFSADGERTVSARIPAFEFSNANRLRPVAYLQDETTLEILQVMDGFSPRNGIANWQYYP